ncbi:SDR family oxidoreductase, partial [Staphylococcus aureus]
GAAGTSNADVTDEASIMSAIHSATEQLGGLDVLVNNAGIEVASPLLLQSTESFDQIVAVNVRGTFLGMKAAAPALVASGGNIVNIASIAGI